MIELKPHTPLDAESEIELRDGTRVLIRAGRPTDEALLEAMIPACSDWSLHHRFFGLARFLSPVEYRCLLGVQDANALSLVGMVNVRGREEMIAIAYFCRERATNFAEVAFLVLDAYQGLGLGSYLLRRLLAVARAQGLAGLTADVMADNTVMLHVFEESHCNIVSTLAGDIYHLRLEFDPIQPRLN